MKSWHLIVDVAKCEDCNNCLLACKDEHVGNDWPGYARPQPRHGHRWIDVAHREHGRFPHVEIAYRPTPCQHCAEAPCVAAGGGAVYRRPDGIVIIDTAKSGGREDIVAACPYGAIYWNAEDSVPQKCTLCAHLLDGGWAKPRCVQACPTGALRAEYLSGKELASLVAAERLEVLHPAFGTRPTVYYKNLYRFEKCFIAGSLAVAAGGTLDCAEGVEVTLHKGAELVATTVSNAFGDFKFDGLPADGGVYIVTAVREDGEKKALTVELTDSISLGTIII